MRPGGSCLLCIALFAASGRICAEDDAAPPPSSCRALARDLSRELEAWTGLRFLRPVRIRVDVEALPGRFCTLDTEREEILIAPRTLKSYREGQPNRWEDLPACLGPELAHALFLQHFDVAGVRTDRDRAIALHLLMEGAAHIASFELQMLRAPDGRYVPERPSGFVEPFETYRERYFSKTGRTFEEQLDRSGRLDGINLMDELVFRAGPAAATALLYRPPPLLVLLRPDLLAAVELSRPPDPFSILSFLSPEKIHPDCLFRANHPGFGRCFEEAAFRFGRVRGCLIGYTTIDAAEHPGSRYALFVTDPDDPGTWREEQIAGLWTLAPDHAMEWTRPLNEIGEIGGRSVHFLCVPHLRSGIILRAECDGLVLLAREPKLSANLEMRMFVAMRVLELRRPVPDLYAAAARAITRSTSEGE